MIQSSSIQIKESNMKYQLMNFNIPYELKEILDEISKRKHVSRTSILNSLIATHCPQELNQLRRLSEELSQWSQLSRPQAASTSSLGKS